MREWLAIVSAGPETSMVAAVVDFSIVLPAYNEAGNIAPIIADLRRLLSGAGRTEIIASTTVRPTARSTRRARRRRRPDGSVCVVHAQLRT
jgi:hypothetical protein